MLEKNRNAMMSLQPATKETMRDPEVTQQQPE